MYTQAPKVDLLLLEVGSKLLEDSPLPMATRSKVKMFDLDEDNKTKTNFVVHVVIVSLAWSTLHGQLIEEGNIYVSVSPIEPRAESMLLYKGNNDDDPLMVCLDNALKSITKWLTETLKAIR